MLFSVGDEIDSVVMVNGSDISSDDINTTIHFVREWDSLRADSSIEVERPSTKRNRVVVRSRLAAYDKRDNP